MKNISMVFKVLICLTFLSFVVPVKNIHAFRDIPEDNLAYPALLMSEEIGGKVTTGSGFFLIDGERLYLITARHVLFDNSSIELKELPKNLNIPYHILYKLSYDLEKHKLSFSGVMSKDEEEELIKSIVDDKLFKSAIQQLYEKSQKLFLNYAVVTIYSYPPKATGDQNQLQLDLPTLFKDGNIKYHLMSDIALIKLGIIKKSEGGDIVEYFNGVKTAGKTHILGLDASNIKKFDDILIGNAIFTFGYPTSVSNNNSFLDIKFPLLRKGIIAGKNTILKIIVLDSPVYQGNSGGLVLEVEREVGKENYKAIGVITNNVPFIKDDSKNFQNSGYSVAVPMDAVLELISDKTKK